MKTKHVALIGLLALLAVVLSGCATGLTASAWAGIAADSTYAYVAGGPYVYAVNLQTGAQAWRFPDKGTPATPFFATPVLTSDGQLIVGGYDKKLYSLNPQTGKSTWTFTGARDRWIAGALVTNGTIYAPNADYNLYALDLKGNQLWSFAADQSIWGTPVTDGTNVYFGTLGKKVYAVNIQSHQQVWMQTLDGAILGSPALGKGNLLYVGSYGGTLYALNTADGKTAWTKTATSWIWNGPVLDGDSLYVGDANGKLLAFSASSGDKLWEQDLNGAIVGTPLVHAGTLVVGTEIAAGTPGSVYFIDSKSKILQTISLTGKSQVYGSAVGAGDLILVPLTSSDTKDPILLALDPAGANKWPPFIPPK